MYDYTEDGDAAAVWAQWALLQPNLRIVDTETTDLYDAEVIEVAVIDGQGETLLHRRVRPVHRIAHDATEVHGLTADLLRDAPDFRAIYPDLRRVLDGGYVVIYNAGFDAPILNRSAELWSLPNVACNLIVRCWLMRLIMATGQTIMATTNGKS